MRQRALNIFACLAALSLVLLFAAAAPALAGDSKTGDGGAKPQTGGSKTEAGGLKAETGGKKTETGGIAAPSHEPIEISAARSLEWNRRNQTYTAHDEAIAKQGPFQVNSDTITARYHDDKGATDIYELTALDHVVIVDAPYTAYGDKAVYEVGPQVATLTGKDLKIVTATESLTARDKIEFFQAENRLTATGDAVAVRGTDTLKADLLNAYFQKDQFNKLVMTKVIADNNVVIVTPKETAYGDHGVYDVPSQKAVLTGKVRIIQGKDVLEGTRADVDMNTGISQLFADGNKTTEGRVTGLFYPKAQNETSKPPKTGTAEKQP